VPCGTTGESPTLSHEEHNRVIEIVHEETAGRVPVIAGTGSNSTAEAIQMTRAAAPHIKAQGEGSIVNVSSISALTGAGSSIAYAASKGALNTMTTALSRALAPEIRVNAVLPGAFPSRWWADGLGEEGAKNLFEKLTAQVPLKSVADPESVARTVVWLLEDAGFITGEMIKIDAGMHLLGFQP